MIKASGSFKEYKGLIVLFVTLDKDDFDNFVNHVQLNMFFSYRRVAPEFKEILLVSIGDHLDTNDNQDLNQAEVCVALTTKDVLSRTSIKRLEKVPYWYIYLSCDKESFVFAIDKATNFITSRSYYNDDEETK